MKAPLLLFWGPGLAGCTTMARWLGWAEACRWEVPQWIGQGVEPPIGRIGPARVRWQERSLDVDLGYRGPLWIRPLSAPDWPQRWERFRAVRAQSLRSAAGVLFVVDSQAERMEANLEFLERLAEDLRHVGREPSEVPITFALNKRDLASVLSVPQVCSRLAWPVSDFVETCAPTGRGVDAAVRRLLMFVDDRG